MDRGSKPPWTERRERVLELGASVWVKLPLERDGVPDNDWDAYYQFVDQDGHATVVEVRILPRTRTKTAEREVLRVLKREGAGRRPPVPPLTAKAVRSVSPTEALHYLRASAGTSESTADTFSRLAEAALGSARRPRGMRRGSQVFSTGMPPDPDVHFAAFAKLYVDVVRQGSRSPIADIAATNPGWDHAYVRDQVYLAREKGFLTPERHGMVGGDLTLKARRVLRGAAD